MTALAAFAQTLTSSMITDDIKYMKMREMFGIISLITKKHIKASPEMLAFAQALHRHEDIVSALPLDADFTVTEFVTAMLYVNSQSRPKEERWDLSSMPSETAKQLAKKLLLEFKKTKTPYAWM